MSQSHPPLPSPPDPARVTGLLRQWLSRALSADASRWLSAELDRQHEAADEWHLSMALGLATRKVGRGMLRLGDDDVRAARATREAWQPEFWSSDEAARVALLLASHRGDDRAFAARLERLCATAEVTEHTAYLKGFAVFPAPQLIYSRAREGVRSAVQPLFEAIACRNPYPRDYFDQDAWNQMVVKCVFIGSPLETVVGLRERKNAELVRMLEDLIAERRSAGRVIPQSVLDYVH
jgi:hypothetical protein